MFGRLSVLPQYLLPKRGLTQFAGRIARAQGGRATTRLIRWFVGKYGVDMSEAENPDIASYASFNDFFGRPLKPGVRPLADADFISPVDGAISQFGAIDDHHILQAKGHRFTTTQLLAGDAALADRFRHGSFANLYLSPKDYHRLHMPCAGRLQRMIYIPGALFSVNPTTARGVPGLFARNERVVCVFDSETHGRRDVRRQHGDHLARRGQSAAHRGDRRMGVCGPPDRARAGRGDGALPARIDRDHAV